MTEREREIVLLQEAVRRAQEQSNIDVQARREETLRFVWLKDSVIVRAREGLQAAVEFCLDCGEVEDASVFAGYVNDIDQSMKGHHGED